MEHPALKLFKRCPSCGSVALAPHSGKAFKCRACSFEFFINAATAVGLVISDREGRVLFLRRAKNPGKGKLGLPGGFVDAFETLEEAARRELMEETGLSLPGPLEYLRSCVNRYEYANVPYASCDVYFHVGAESLKLAKPLDETEAVLALKPEEVDPAEFAFDSVRDAISEYLSRKRRS